MKVSQFAPNHTVVQTDEGTMFVSYSSNIIFIPKDGKIQLGKNWDYSKTTGKYRNQFLGETKKETQANLDKGEYVYNPAL